MKPIIVDEDTGARLWRAIDCAEHCGITRGTWANYAANGRVPEPVAMLDRHSPLWAADDVITWHANRPGSPVKNHPRRGRR